jgi:hypothetical protein
MIETVVGEVGADVDELHRAMVATALVSPAPRGIFHGRCGML